jgi:DNA repair protein RadC
MKANVIYRQTLVKKDMVSETAIAYEGFNDSIVAGLDAVNFAAAFWDKDALGIFESFYCLYLNQANKPICWARIAEGCIHQVLVDVRIIMQHGLACGAVGFIAFHNHPSGNLKPSNSDFRLTKKLKDAGDIMDIKLLDHIIIGTDFKRVYSFLTEGTL